MSNFITLDDLFVPFWDILKDRSVFCGFKIIGEQKVPTGIDGQAGLGADASIERFGTYRQVKDLNFPFIGLSLMNPIMVGDKYLLCLDFDWKRAPDNKADIEQINLMATLQSMGAYYETSYSGKGAHYWVLCELANIPRSIKLPNNCEIEVFSGLPNAKSNVLITDYDIEGELKVVDVKSIFPKVQESEKKPAPKLGTMTVNIADNLVKAKEVLQYISPDDYEIWIKAGMILKGEFGDNAYDLWNFWSSKSDKYDPEIMFNKWNSFTGSGLTIASLVAMGQDSGYEAPKPPKPSAQQDFLTDPVTGQIVIKKRLDSRKVELAKRLIAPEWVIDGIIPSGVGSLSGFAGVGKTTAIIPLACAAGGFISHLDNLKVSVRRKVVIFTEQPSQIERLLYGIKKHMTLKGSSQHPTWDEISEWIHLINSKRETISELQASLSEACNDYVYEHEKMGKVSPLIILDTAAANLKVEQENDNGEISNNMAMIKELGEKHNANFWIINHLSKDAKNQSIDQIMNMTARGGSAWGSDANWTALIGKANPEDIDSDTILKIDKERIGTLRGAEIVFTAAFHPEMMLDKLGEPVEVSYPVVGMKKSETATRKKEAYKKQLNEYHEAIFKAVKETIYPSGVDIHKIVGGKKTDFDRVIRELIACNSLQYAPLPADMRKGRKTEFLLVPSKQE
jgi:hypothetical protein